MALGILPNENVGHLRILLIRFFLIKELNRYTNITLTILFDTYVIILINVTNDSIYVYESRAKNKESEEK